MIKGFLLDNEYIPDVLPMDKSTSDCITYDDEREELDEPDSLPLSPAFTFKRNSLLTPSKGQSKSPQQFFDDFIAPSPIKSEYGYFQVYISFYYYYFIFYRIYHYMQHLVNMLDVSGIYGKYPSQESHS